MLDDVIARIVILQRRVMIKIKELREDEGADHFDALMALEEQFDKLIDAKTNLLEIKLMAGVK